MPSIRLFPDAHVLRVFEHLRDLGHDRIDCVNTHFHTPEIQRRVRLWREWTTRRGVRGDLWDKPAPSFSDPMPLACDLARGRLERGPLGATAVVGTTFTAAVGVMRALWERGVRVGTDVSVAAVNVEPPARFMTPAVTGLDTPDLSAVLRRVFTWFAGDAEWHGLRRLEPGRASFFTGESTGPAAG